MAQRGYACIVPEYRLSGEKPSQQQFMIAKRRLDGLVEMPKDLTLILTESPAWGVQRVDT